MLNYEAALYEKDRQRSRVYTIEYHVIPPKEKKHTHIYIKELLRKTRLVNLTALSQTDGHSPILNENIHCS